MSKRISTFGLLVLMLGILDTGVCTVNAKENVRHNDVAKVEVDANELADRIMPTGWIDTISAEQVIIDDTLYLLTDGTTYPSGRNSLKRGGFVEFTLGKDNYIAQISTAIPWPKDIEMRRGEQFSRTTEKPEKKQIKEGRQPYLENGVWVN